ncbi:MAG: hypothetical protein JEZ07_07325 [Phycisphaerae bacterium]|nr:hypothetical protein [Phycisphaerae bacterium]
MSNRIIKQNLIQGPQGQIIGRQTEQIIDDGVTIRSETIQSATRCPSCHRPIHDITQWMGRCDCCGHALCNQCISICHACRRRICGRCRHSFVGQRLLQVCCSCLPKLYKRQGMMDKIMFSKEKFRRQQQLRQNALRRKALYLQSRRQGIKDRIALYRLTTPTRTGARNAQRRR